MPLSTIVAKWPEWGREREEEKGCHYLQARKSKLKKNISR